MNRFRWSVVLAGLALASATTLLGQSASQPAGGGQASFISLTELKEFYADKAKKARQAVEADRLAALEAFLKKAPASEKQQTLLAMIESAAILEDSDRILALTDDYLKNTASAEEAWTVRQLRFSTLVAAGRTDQVKAEWEKGSEKIDMEVWQQTFDSAMIVADGLLEAGRVEDVRALYKSLRSKFSFVSNLSQVLEPREASLKWLGKPAPAIEGQDMNGNTVTLAQYKGKVVLIDFWATWCQPCIMAMPELAEVYKTYRGAGFEIIGISLDQDKDVLTRFLQSKPLPWPNLYDGKAWFSPNARRYEVNSIPATFIVGPDGKIVSAGTPSRGYAPTIKRLLASSSKRP